MWDKKMSMVFPICKAFEENLYHIFGGHLMSINLLPRKWEEYYPYSSMVGGKFAYFRCKDPPTIVE
jgi:hypothetical protein